MKKVPPKKAQEWSESLKSTKNDIHEMLKCNMVRAADAIST